MYTYHSSTSTGNSRVTVCGEFTNGKLNLAVSRCSNADNFNRKRGRLIASGRLAKGKLAGSVSLNNCSSETFHEIAIPLAQKVVESKVVVTCEEDRG